MAVGEQLFDSLFEFYTDENLSLENDKFLRRNYFQDFEEFSCASDYTIFVNHGITMEAHIYSEDALVGEFNDQSFTRVKTWINPFAFIPYLYVCNIEQTKNELVTCDIGILRFFKAGRI